MKTLSKLLIIAVITLIGCSDNIHLTDTIITSNYHAHNLDYEHTHSAGKEYHTHSGQEIIDEIAGTHQHVQSDSNPFSQIIISTQQILATPGGGDMLEIALSSKSNEDKLREILTMPHSEAKSMMIEAYSKHNQWITSVYDIITNPSTTKPKPKTNLRVQGTRVQAQ